MEQNPVANQAVSQKQAETSPQDSQDKKQNRLYTISLVIVLVIFVIIGIPSAAILTRHAINLWTEDNDEQPTPISTPISLDEAGLIKQQADTTMLRAEETIEMSNLILSFLEGASVLVALALGTAAVFGIQNARELRQEIKSEREKTEKLFEKISPHEKALETLDSDLKEFKQAKEAIQQDFVDLLQANTELSLKNYEEAYRRVTGVLARSANNVQALYIAGWLETQYIPDRLPKAKEHLDTALKLDPHSPSVRAAYGVALRRMGLKAKGTERESLLNDSQIYLDLALRIDKNLIDLNYESFYGPQGGNFRDLSELPDDKFDSEKLNAAIISYEKALNVTPRSSYPMGNLAALYLQKKDHPKAMESFAKTVQFATVELVLTKNDYFVMMDLAMANTMLGHLDKKITVIDDRILLEPVTPSPDKYFARADEWLKSALSDYTNATHGMLSVSLGGWKRLKRHTPEEWNRVHTQLQKGIEAIEKTMEQRPDMAKNNSANP